MQTYIGNAVITTIQVRTFLALKTFFVSVLLVAVGNKDKSFEGERIPVMYILHVLEADATV